MTSEPSVAEVEGPTPFDFVCQSYLPPEKVGPHTFDPHPLQVGAINRRALCDHAGLWLDMGCVDCETEYLSPQGWKRIDAYSGGRVAQFVPQGVHGEGRAEFVEPLAYISKPCDEMLVFETTRGVSQKLSRDHRVAYVGPAGKFKEASAQDVFDRYQQSKLGWAGRFVTTFHAEGAEGINLGENDLRLTVAVIADGHFPNKGSRCVIRLRKQRKKARLRELLRKAGITYKEFEEPWDGCEGFTRFTFRAPLRTKAFSEDFYRSTHDQLRVISDEVSYWDSHVPSDENRGTRFSTSSKASADFIQYALSGTGTRNTLSVVERVRDGKAVTEYQVQWFTRSPLAYLRGSSPNSDGSLSKSPNVWTEPTTDGMQYCFSVPSSYLVLRRNGCVFVTGNCGKTFVATWLALFNLLTRGYSALIIMPPVLIPQWARWLRSLRPQPGAAPISVTEYRGNPAQRAKLNLHATFVLCGIQIFKRDFERFVAAFSGRGFTLIVDEATTIANINTDNHEKVYDFSLGMPQIMLTGTPADPPSNAYALLKFSAPGTYRNLKHFRTTHIDEVDLYKKVLSWKGLDDLALAMKKNSERILFSDMYSSDQEPLISTVDYELEADHHRLYKRLADEQLLQLPDGGKIDATTVQRLTHALGQIIVNHGHFSGDPADTSAIFDYLDLKLEGLAGGKLVVYAHYQMTVQKVVEHYAKFGAVGYNGAVSERQKEKNKQRFIEDPNCRVFVLQYASGGLGLDGLQWVCNHGVMIEPCRQAYVFRQSIARLKRTGQKFRVMIDIMIAKKTLQVRAFKDLLNNDDVACKIIPNKTELRKLIYGEPG